MDATRFHQQVPRPSVVVQGEPPSWLTDPSIDRAVSQPLESLLDHLVGRLGDLTSVPEVTYAVLIGLFAMGDQAGVLLTRRAATLRSEPLVISFPGGRLKPGERPVDAALREAEEEVGIDPGSVRVLGTLPLLRRRSDRGRVLPVVAHLQGDLVLKPNPEEVDAVLEVPLRALVAEGAAWSERWGSSRRSREMHFFTDEGSLGADLVWGLTAHLLWQLLGLLAEDEGR